MVDYFKEAVLSPEVALEGMAEEEEEEVTVEAILAEEGSEAGEAAELNI